MATPRTSGTIDIDGLPVFYETEGDGDTIVLLHGGLADNSTWAAQFSGLSPHRRVVAPERQAQGHTPDRPGPLSYQAMTEQTVSFLVALGLGPVDLLGWSDGGMVGTLRRGRAPRARPDVDRHGIRLLERGIRPGLHGGPRESGARRRRHGDVRRHVRPSLPGRSGALPRRVGEGAHHVGPALRLDGRGPADHGADPRRRRRRRLHHRGARTGVLPHGRERAAGRRAGRVRTWSRWRSRISSTGSCSTSRPTRSPRR